MQGSTLRWDAPGSIVAWVAFGLCFTGLLVQQHWSITTTPERRLILFDLFTNPMVMLAGQATYVDEIRMERRSD
jgi:hypothetical protein